MDYIMDRPNQFNITKFNFKDYAGEFWFYFRVDRRFVSIRFSVYPLLILNLHHLKINKDKKAEEIVD